ncbi:MAG: Glyoxalase/bleomycin resistance protein/dioxygenase [Panacagrimonas sp.]|jgi:2,3-dihydroxybiphenyl 1,2-dioxygenase|nr:VOC family protein [Panacagrimonas sp.]MCC2657554.1 Glyoxalase/bleomycin resistance protein/dioxygenase [Panacagrimonas sp.]
MAEISSLGYLCVTSNDLDGWAAFAGEILGMSVASDQSSGSLVLRMDEFEQRLRIETGPEDDLVAVGWHFETADTLEAYVRQLAVRGISTTPGDVALTASRRVEQLHVCTDPDGIRHEFFYGPAHAARPFRSPVLRGDFVTGDLGVGHYVSAAKDYAKTVAFHRDGLGLKVSDRIRAPLMTPHGPIPFDATFFHTATGRHHSFATAALPFPKRVHHIMVEVSDFNDVGLAYDRCLAADVPIMMGLGHHPNDGMFSFYAVTPSGFAVEFGHGGCVVDDRTWQVRTYSQLSDWGHAPPAAASAHR